MQASEPPGTIAGGLAAVKPVNGASSTTSATAAGAPPPVAAAPSDSSATGAAETSAAASVSQPKTTNAQQPQPQQPPQPQQVGHIDAQTVRALVVNATKVVEEFQYLLEQSQQLFGGLRDLPPTGSQRLWQPYFQKTFEVYTKLWKFQQHNRAVLEHKDYYGLKRWEIGEIASKIGQLYYHYYLRTSETNYLSESFVFYEAIRDRAYFKDVLATKNRDLTVKHLRYYARYIVVCLLLNKNDTVKQLMEELSSHVADYTKAHAPSDAHEWQVVLQEAWSFHEAMAKIMPIDEDASTAGKLVPLPVPTRLAATSAPPPHASGRPNEPYSKLRLAEALIIGFSQTIKFSELTIDMYRVLQSLEREPSSQSKDRAAAAAAAAAASSASKGANENGAESTNKGSHTELVAPAPSTTTAAAAGENTENEASASTATATTTNGAALKPKEEKEHRRTNPHKALLYRPSVNQLLVYLSSACRDAHESGALFLYMSSDHATADLTPPACAKPTQGYTLGIPTTHLVKGKPALGETPEATFVHSLHPGDLVPFSRRPLFVIVEGGVAEHWRTFPTVFAAPIVILAGPQAWSPKITDPNASGSLFTLFLHSPLVAMMTVFKKSRVSSTQWQSALQELDQVMQTVEDILSEGDGQAPWKAFMHEEFLSKFLVRFVVCYVFLRLLEPDAAATLPSIFPVLPEYVLNNEGVISRLQEVTALLGGSFDGNGTTEANNGAEAAAA